ncbi:MAG: hypothetical protein AB7Q27_15545 [Acidimicrobiia bacterium]
MTTTESTPTEAAQLLPDRLHVCADTTAGAHPTGSDQIEWWLPVIGPSCTVLAQLLARNTPTGGATWDTVDLARRIGFAGSQSRLWRTLNRLDLFGVAHFHATDVLTIRLWLPTLTGRHLTRLPADMADLYRRQHLTPYRGT